LEARSGTEPDGVRSTGHGVADEQTPQAEDLDRLVVGAADRAELLAGGGVERVDQTVTEVADEQVARELAEVGGRDGQPPRRVQQGVPGGALPQLTRRGEAGEETAAP